MTFVNCPALLYGVAVDPASERRVVVAELVFVKPCSLVERLGGEAEKEGIGEVAGLFNRYAERRVDVTRADGAGHINIFGNISR